MRTVGGSGYLFGCSLLLGCFIIRITVTVCLHKLPVQLLLSFWFLVFELVPLGLVLWDEVYSLGHLDVILPEDVVKRLLPQLLVDVNLLDQEVLVLRPFLLLVVHQLDLLS